MQECIFAWLRLQQKCIQAFGGRNELKGIQSENGTQLIT